MKPKKHRGLVAINQEQDAIRESLSRLETVHREDRFIDNAAYERSAHSIAYLQNRLLELTLEKHSRFNTKDPVAEKALDALWVASEAGRKITAAPSQ
jgi:hypothetical protein